MTIESQYYKTNGVRYYINNDKKLEVCEICKLHLGKLYICKFITTCCMS